MEKCAQILAVASDKGATVCIEWPRACRYWHCDRVKRGLAKYGLVNYDFDGCMYGIKPVIQKTLDMPIKKPLRLATTSPIIGKAFSTRCCGHTHHAQCEGKDTTQTEGYSTEFANVFHKAWKVARKSTFKPQTLQGKGPAGIQTNKLPRLGMARLDPRHGPSCQSTNNARPVRGPQLVPNVDFDVMVRWGGAR